MSALNVFKCATTFPLFNGLFNPHTFQLKNLTNPSDELLIVVTIEQMFLIKCP